MLTEPQEALLLLSINKAEAEVYNRLLIRNASYLEEIHFEPIGLIYIVKTKNLRKSLPYQLTPRISPKNSFNFILGIILDDVLEVV